MIICHHLRLKTRKKGPLINVELSTFLLCLCYKSNDFLFRLNSAVKTKKFLYFK